MPWVRRAWLAFVVVMLGLPACESIFEIDEPKLRGSAGAPSVIAEVAERLAAARCGALANCLGPLYARLLGDRHNHAGFRDESCELVMERALLARELAGLDEAIASGRVLYDASRMQECTDAIAELGCDLDLVERPNACVLALSGARSIDESCFSNVECKDAFFCDTTSTCPGLCKPRRAAGGACSDPVVLAPKTARECALGLSCVEGKCEKLPRETESCELVANRPLCTTGMFCVESVCRKLSELTTLAAGAECFPLGGTLCDPSLGCEITTPKDPFPPTGSCAAPYASADNCCTSFPELCPKGWVCKAECFAGQTGSCQALPGKGEPCTTTCQPLMRCISGTCQPLAELGQPCVANGVCYSGRCDDFVCREPCDDAPDGG